MSRKCSTLLCIIVFPVLTACSTMKSAPDTCSVIPPSDIKSDRKTAAEAAIDLKALAALPASANFKAELSRTFNATFQKVPDLIAACAMLNQTYVCINDAERSTQYLEFMRDTKQCQK